MIIIWYRKFIYIYKYKYIIIEYIVSYIILHMIYPGPGCTSPLTTALYACWPRPSCQKFSAALQFLAKSFQTHTERLNFQLLHSTSDFLLYFYRYCLPLWFSDWFRQTVKQLNR